MLIQESPSKRLLVEALQARALRQDLIAANIANIDTPFYKARDIDFETVLRQKAKELYGSKMPQELTMTQTHIAHMKETLAQDTTKATLYLRDGHMSRNDGNSVDLDVESSELSKNAIMFNAITAALQKNGIIFRSVIEASSKI